ncbi:hypothetical protein [Actinokineospora enzanensis]|uniref:hypothetical protein n=1 Tax=Actinokineospora enzanensis TaxID=155975 RepID=UPI0003A4A3EF|nr:hypothetical protein [Actinokineospora enzanensis]
MEAEHVWFIPWWPALVALVVLLWMRFGIDRRFAAALALTGIVLIAVACAAPPVQTPTSVARPTPPPAVRPQEAGSPR